METRLRKVTKGRYEVLDSTGKLLGTVARWDWNDEQGGRVRSWRAWRAGETRERDIVTFTTRRKAVKDLVRGVEWERKNGTSKVWMFEDDQNRLGGGVMFTVLLRQMLGLALPETLPPALPIVFPSAEVAEAYSPHNPKFEGMRPVEVDFEDPLTAFVMVQAVTDEECLFVVKYKEDGGKGWVSMPFSVPNEKKWYMFVRQGKQQVLSDGDRRGFVLAPTLQLAQQYVRFTQKRFHVRISVAEIGSVEGETLNGQLAVAHQSGVADCVFVLRRVEGGLMYDILEFK